MNPEKSKQKHFGYWKELFRFAEDEAKGQILCDVSVTVLMLRSLHTHLLTAIIDRISIISDRIRR